MMNYILYTTILYLAADLSVFSVDFKEAAE